MIALLNGQGQETCIENLYVFFSAKIKQNQGRDIFRVFLTLSLFSGRISIYSKSPLNALLILSLFSRSVLHSFTILHSKLLSINLQLIWLSSNRSYIRFNQSSSQKWHFRPFQGTGFWIWDPHNIIQGSQFFQGSTAVEQYLSSCFLLSLCYYGTIKQKCPLVPFNWIS